MPQAPATAEELELEKDQILSRYRGLLRSLRTDRTPEGTRQIRKAFNIAMEAHSTQRRKSGEPYIYHPIAVARICAEEIGLGVTSVVSALLHDTVEDTDITLDDVREIFGDTVCTIIDGLTKISGVNWQTDSMQAENFRKVLLTLAQDIRVILIKLADRLHNMRTLDGLPREKQLKIASETLFLYAPLAHRLGLYAIKSELEDLALKYTEPAVYADIEERLKKGESVRKRFISRFILPIREALEREGLEFEIKGRTKSINSIYNKMVKKHVSFEEVYDVFAIRIIVDSKPELEKADCWKVYSIVTDYYQPSPDRLRDWISRPKANGYESLHTTVMSPGGKWVEVQIRSRRMDESGGNGLGRPLSLQGRRAARERHGRYAEQDPGDPGRPWKQRAGFRAGLQAEPLQRHHHGIHAYRGYARSPQRRHCVGLRLRDTQPDRAALHRRKSEPPARAVEPSAAQRRPGGDHHQPQADAERGLAQLRGDGEGPAQDQTGAARTKEKAGNSWPGRGAAPVAGMGRKGEQGEH
jgi:hypothetical protein